MREHQPHPGPSVPQWWAGTHDRGVYRRYTWTLNYFDNRYNISRDGHHIGSEDSLAGVKATIDMLTADEGTSR